MHDRSFAFCLLALSLGLGSAACSTFLGDFEVDSVDASTSIDASSGLKPGKDAMPDRAPTPDRAVSDAASNDATTDAVSDAASPDTGGPDAGSGGCAAGPIACDGGCGSISDLQNCGSCGNDCTGLPFVATTGLACAAGRCVYTCAAGHADCADAGTGCTTDIASSANCGACGTACSGAAPVCARHDAGPPACGAACGAGEINCGGSCANLAIDPSHCGACGTVCGGAQATEICSASTCAIGTCASGYADCDKLASTGCEVNTASDVHNCGGCGVVCAPPHATASCHASTCAIASCASGYADCDGVASNGCETDLSLPANCGACSTASKPTACSGATPVCSNSGGAYHCLSGCMPSAPTLCNATTCVDTTSDPNNCGSCGNVCKFANAAASCVASACVLGACNAGYADCDNVASTGCEVNTTSSAANCGGCGKACSTTKAVEACTSSSCTVVSCSAGFGDCDGLAATGCETDTTSDSNHCGSCTHACAGTQSCVSSACQCPASVPTFCSAAGACINTTNDAANCGTCGHACATGMSCENSTCAFRWPDSYDDSFCTNDTAAIPCPTSSGQVGWGEDGSYHITPAAYQLTSTVVTDLVTGLFWERILANGMTGQFTQAQALAHCVSIGASAYGGFTDWRLPTAREVATIDDMGNSTGDPNALSRAVFQNLQMNSALWTQTPYAGNAASFWVLDINWPVMEPYLATETWPGGVSCVRGPALPTGAYVVSASGNIVFDPRTNLNWQRGISPTTNTFLQAVAYCNGLSLDGFADWRLANYKELFSIVDTTRTSPAIDPTAFPSTPAAFFWSSSAAPIGISGGQAYSIDFTSGGGFNVDPTTNLYEARCVRGG